MLSLFLRVPEARAGRFTTYGHCCFQRSGLSVRICQKPELTPGLPEHSDKEQEVCLTHREATIHRNCVSVV